MIDKNRRGVSRYDGKEFLCTFLKTECETDEEYEDESYIASGKVIDALEEANPYCLTKEPNWGSFNPLHWAVFRSKENGCTNVEGFEAFEMAFSQLRIMFSPDENVNVVFKAEPDKHGKLAPADSGIRNKTASQIAALIYPAESDKSRLTYRKYRDKEHFDEIADIRAGAWIRVNPTDGKGIADTNVTDFRNMLIECDDIPQVDQEFDFRECGIPISILIDSGGRSIHAVVRVDAATIEQYHEIFDFLYHYFLERYGIKIDTQNRNPSRLMRFAGFTRNGKVQRVLAMRIGAPSFTAWLDSEEGKIAAKINDEARWAVPVPLDGAPIPDFTVRGIFPDEVEEMLDQFAEYSNMPRVLPYMTLLGTYSYVLMDKARVRTWQHRKRSYDTLNLYIMLVTRSGRGKSTTFKPLFDELVRDWRQKARGEYAEARQKARIHVELIQEEIEQLKKLFHNAGKKTKEPDPKQQAGDREALAERISDKEHEIERINRALPPNPANVFDDMTPEKVARKLGGTNGIGAIVASDAQVVKNFLGMYSKQGTANIETLLRGFDHELYGFGRVSDDTDYEKEILLSCLIFAQQGIARSFLNNPEIGDRGGAGRFLAFMPREKPPVNPVGKETIPQIEDSDTYQALKETIEGLLENTGSLYYEDSSETTHDGKSSKEHRMEMWKEYTMYFDESINVEGTDWYNFHEVLDEYLTNNPSRVPQDAWDSFINRQAQVVQRLAGLIHIIQRVGIRREIGLDTLKDVCAIPINPDTLKKAIEISEHCMQSRIAESTADAMADDIVEFCIRAAERANAHTNEDGRIIFEGDEVTELMRFKGHNENYRNNKKKYAPLLKQIQELEYIQYTKGAGKEQRVELNPKLFTPERIADPSKLKKAVRPEYDEDEEAHG